MNPLPLPFNCHLTQPPSTSTDIFDSYTAITLQRRTTIRYVTAKKQSSAAFTVFCTTTSSFLILSTKHSMPRSQAFKPSCFLACFDLLL